MLLRLEEVLKEKERELKLHERFLNLKRFCEEEVFPYATVPLGRHVDRLKGFIERLIPEPKDRTEQLFSGEIFTLLCAVYFHDIGVVSRLSWSASEEILSRIDSSPRTLFLNHEIARRLDIPESAIELVNAIIFSPVVKKIPIDWEIVEGPRKAIIRNGRILEQILSFAHLLWDIFSADSGHVSLRRFQNTNLRLRCGDASLAVDSREGLIYIRCRPEVPYQYHALEEIRSVVEDAFDRFREGVNGRLGFQYQKLVWEIAEEPEGRREPILPMPQLFPFTTYRDMPFKRWDEASQLLDKLFRFGYVIVVGETNTGKTTLINSFVIPQLQRISMNVFYTELWESPVNELREAAEKSGRMPSGAAPDIVSIATHLAQRAPCFFILDGCERLKFISDAEKEKLERFIDFCLSREDVYLVAVGDKEEFFDWYRPFARTSLSALFETRELDGAGIAEVSRTEESELIPPLALHQTLEEMAARVSDRNALREVVAALVDIHLSSLRRYSLSVLHAETCIPHDKIIEVLKELKGKGIVREYRVSDASFYALSSRHLKEPLYEQLGLSEFDDKRRIAEAIKRAASMDEPLPVEILELVDQWKDHMLCSRDHMGLVLASLVARNLDVETMLRKAEADRQGVNAMPLIRLLEQPDREARMRALGVLAALKADAAINPLLERLKQEKDPDLRAKMAETIVATGKRNTILALTGLLAEQDDKVLRGSVVEQVAAFPGTSAQELLLEMGDLEKDPELIDRIDEILAKLQET